MKNAVIALTLILSAPRFSAEAERLGKARKLLFLHRHQSSFIVRSISPLHRDPQRVVYKVRPRETDPLISIFLQDHYVMFNRAVPQNGKLFLYFPGTFGLPMLDQLLLNEAASKGFKAISLEYPNATDSPDFSAVASLCNADPDPDCAEKVRRERLFGEQISPHVAITPNDSAINRLQKLMAWLVAKHPEDGWAQFYSEKTGELDWSKVVIAGHSQGAGMAAYLAKIYLVSRVAMFSGPDDEMASLHGAAPWLSRPGVTPLNRHYAMSHQREETRHAIDASLNAMGFGSNWTLVTDFSQTPSPSLHHLMVNLEPRKQLPVGDSYHVSIETDPITPRLPDGSPAYARVWDEVIGN